MILDVTSILKRSKDEPGKHLLLLGGDCPVRADGASGRQLVLEALEQEMRGEERASGGNAGGKWQEAAFRKIEAEPMDSPVRRRIVLSGLRDVYPTSGHVRLARLICAGYFGSVIVFGANDLLEQALTSERLTADTDYNLVVIGCDSAERARGALEQSAKATLVKVYGDVGKGWLPLSPSERRRALDELARIIGPISDQPLFLVNLSEEEEALLPKLQRHGGPVFWVHPKAPVLDQSRYEELRAGSEEEFRAHDFRPELARFLADRDSARNFATRTNGQFDYFIAHLHQRLLLPGLEKHISSLKGTRPAVLPDAPYKFLAPFETADETIFTGREAEQETLAEMVRKHRLAVLVGDAGVGKTSLIQAGLVPVLEGEEEDKGEDQWLAIVSRPLLLPAVPEKVLGRLEAEQADAVRPDADKSLCEFLAKVSEVTGRQCLLAVDNWEEVWTHLPEGDRKEIVETVADCAEVGGEGVHLLLSVRSEFFADLCDVRGQLPNVFNAVMHLKRFTRDQGRAAITRPAQKFHLVVEGALVEELLDELYGDGIDPSELELLCYELLRTLSPTERFISQTKYSMTGGVRAILEGFLESALRRMSRRSRTLAMRILREMSGPNQERVVVARDWLLETTGIRPKVLDRMVWELGDAGLVRPMVAGSVDQLELTHDFVARAATQHASPEEQRPRQVHMLLARALRAYQEHGTLLSNEELRGAEGVAEHLQLSADEWEMVLRSALELEMPVEPWLAHLPRLGEKQLPLLGELLTHESREVRQKALSEAERLMRAGLSRQLLELVPDTHPEARKELEALLQRTDRELTEALRSGDAQQRKQTVGTLARLGSEKATRSLVTALGDRDAGVRHAAARALGTVGDERTLPMLMRRLEEGAPEARWEIAEALATIASRMPVSTIMRSMSGTRRGPLGLLTALIPAAVQPVVARLAGRPWAPMVSDYVVGRALARRRNVGAAQRWLERALSQCRQPDEAEVVRAALAGLGEVEAQLKEGYYLWPCFHKDTGHSGYSPEQVVPPLEQQWSVRFKGEVTCAPVAAGGTAYAVSRNGEIAAVDVRSGAQVWKTSVPKTEGSPALSDDRIYIGCENGNFVCLSTEDGRTLWQHRHDDSFRAPPVANGNVVVAASWRGRVYCWDGDTGKMLWRREAASQVRGCPAMGPDFVAVGDWNGDLTCLELASGGERWRFRAGAEIHGAPALGDECIVVSSDDGFLYKVSAREGRLVWQSALGARLRSSPAVAGDRVVIGTGDGSLCAVSLDEANILWRTKSAEEIVSSPAVAGETVYYGSRDGSLCAASLSDGTSLWTFKTPFAVLGSPAIIEGAVVVPLRFSELCGLMPTAVEGSGTQR